MSYEAVALRVQFNWGLSGVWAGDQVVNTLHAAFLPTGDLATTIGPFALPTVSVDDDSGQYVVPGGPPYPFSCVRGWNYGGRTAWDAWVNNFVQLFGTFWGGGLNAMFSNTLSLKDIRLYAPATSGRHAALSPTILTPTSAVAGSGTSCWSPDIAVVASLYSALKTKRGRGRWYYGGLKIIGLDTSGLIPSADRTTLGSNLVSLINGMRATAVAGRTLAPMIMHRSNPLTTGVLINQVRVGDEVDHQERRTKKRPETYSNFTVT